MLPFNAGKDALTLVSVGVYCDAPKFDNMSWDRKLRVSVLIGPFDLDLSVFMVYRKVQEPRLNLCDD